MDEERRLAYDRMIAKAMTPPRDQALEWLAAPYSEHPAIWITERTLHVALLPFAWLCERHWYQRLYERVLNSTPLMLAVVWFFLLGLIAVLCCDAWSIARLVSYML